jgi:hypothetical protein
MGKYFLMFLVIAVILFVINESIKKRLDFNKNERMYEFGLKNFKNYTIIKNMINVIQSIILVVTLVITSVSIYSMALPSQY